MLDFRAQELKELRAHARTALILSQECRIKAVRAMMLDDAAGYMVDWWIKSRAF
jgi:hypothetical protein